MTSKSERPRGSSLAVEPLEDRSLLSATLAIDSPDDSTTGEVRGHESPDAAAAVQIIEITPAEDDASESAQEIAIERLPRQIASSLSTRFPGARLIAAETSIENESLLYEVTAFWRGIELDISLSPAGDVIEIGQSIDSEDLPETLGEWLAMNFPGAEVQEVELVMAEGELTFEVTFATAGEESLEARLRVAQSRAELSGLSFDSGRDLSADVSVDELVSSFIRREVADAAQAADPLASADSPASLDAEVQAATVEAEHAREKPSESAEDRARGGEADAQVFAVPDDVSTDADADPVQALSGWAMPSPLVPGIGSAISVWPQLAGPLGEIFALDALLLERGLQQFLDEIDALTDEIGPLALDRLTPRLLIAAATLAGAERLVTQWNKRRRDPVLSSAGNKSTWTWVLKLTDSEPPSSP